MRLYFSGVVELVNIFKYKQREQARYRCSYTKEWQWQLARNAPLAEVSSDLRSVANTQLPQEDYLQRVIAITPDTIKAFLVSSK